MPPDPDPVVSGQSHPPRQSAKVEALDTRAACGTVRTMRGGWVYILANRANGVLYVGVTAELASRVDQHCTGEGGRFTARYGVHRLVHAEPFDDIENAIRREKAIKRWPRQWKIDLIRQNNPGWRDLYEALLS